MTINTTKILDVLDAQAGKLKTTIIEQPEKGNLEEVAPYPRDHYGNMTIDPLRLDKTLSEAATGAMSVANFPDMLRIGLQFDAFTGFNGVQTVHEQLVRTIASNKQQEEYGDDEGIGLLPVVAEGQDYPEVVPTIGGGTTIRNHKRGMLLHVTEEAMKFDQIGIIREATEKLGRAARMTREQQVLNALTTTTNYNVKNNNDQAGNNYQTLQFSPVNLNTALALMLTQKDRKSGQYLGVQPSILVIGPLLERFARMLIGSPDLMRVGTTTANDVYGGGTNNPFFGVVSRIVVSPMFGASYQWALLDPSRAIYLQQVESLRVEIEAGNMTSESWLKRDTIRYKVRDWYGVGMRDDRFAFYSDSTSAPIAA